MSTLDIEFRRCRSSLSHLKVLMTSVKVTDLLEDFPSVEYSLLPPL